MDVDPKVKYIIRNQSDSESVSRNESLMEDRLVILMLILTACLRNMSDASSDASTERCVARLMQTSSRCMLMMWELVRLHFRCIFLYWPIVSSRTSDQRNLSHAEPTSR